MKQVQWIWENIPDVQVRMQPGQSKDPHLGCECEISTEKNSLLTVSLAAVLRRHLYIKM